MVKRTYITVPQKLTTAQETQFPWLIRGELIKSGEYEYQIVSDKSLESDDVSGLLSAIPSSFALAQVKVEFKEKKATKTIFSRISKAVRSAKESDSVDYSKLIKDEISAIPKNFPTVPAPVPAAVPAPAPVNTPETKLVEAKVAAAANSAVDNAALVAPTPVVNKAAPPAPPPPPPAPAEQAAAQQAAEEAEKAAATKKAAEQAAAQQAAEKAAEEAAAKKAAEEAENIAVEKGIEAARAQKTADEMESRAEKANDDESKFKLLFDKAKEKADEAEKKLEEKQTLLGTTTKKVTELESQHEDKKAEIARATEETTKNTNTLNEIQKVIETLTEDTAWTEKEVHELRGKQEELGKQVNKTQTAQKQLGFLDVFIKIAKVFVPSIKTYAEATEKVQTSLNESNISLKANIESLKKLNDDLSTNQKKADDIKKELSSQNTKTTELNLKIDTLSTELKTAQDLKATAETELTAAQAQVETTKAAVAPAKEGFEKATEKVNTARSEADAAKDRLDETKQSATEALGKVGKTQGVSTRIEERMKKEETFILTSKGWAPTPPPPATAKTVNTPPAPREPLNPALLDEIKAGPKLKSATEPAPAIDPAKRAVPPPPPPPPPRRAVASDLEKKKVDAAATPVSTGLNSALANSIIGFQADTLKSIPTPPPKKTSLLDDIKSPLDGRKLRTATERETLEQEKSNKNPLPKKEPTPHEKILALRRAIGGEDEDTETVTITPASLKQLPEAAPTVVNAAQESITTAKSELNNVGTTSAAGTSLPFSQKPNLVNILDTINSGCITLRTAEERETLNKKPTPTLENLKPQPQLSQIQKLLQTTPKETKTAADDDDNDWNDDNSPP